MTDIDFDELDRAVNSLMVDGAETPTAVQSANVAEPTESSAEPVSAAVAASAVTPPSAAIDAAPEAPEAPKVVTRPRGRFMDIKPKSGDAVDSSSRPATVNIVARDKTVLEPSTNFDLTSATPTDVDPAPEAAAPVEVPAAIDAQPPVATTEVAPEPTIETPFLSDAKVEKRPLGGPVESDDFVAPPEQVEADLMDDITAETTDESTATDTDLDEIAPAEVATQMPAELAGDIINVEASGLAMEAAPEDAEVTAPTLETTSLTPPEPKVSTDDLDQSQATLYDVPTEVVTAKKKHTGIWILLEILLCVVIGAGGGYIVFVMQ